MNAKNILSFTTRFPFAIFGALAFLPYLFELQAYGTPLPIPTVVKSIVSAVLSVPWDAWDVVINLAYPGEEFVWYRNWLTAGTATVLMYLRAVLVESAQRGVKLGSGIILAISAFLFWPVFIPMMIMEYFKLRSDGREPSAVPYLVFLEAPAYALLITTLSSVAGLAVLSLS